jgi:hypothetical protein
MSGNTIGVLFKVTMWGESHGRATGAVVDGCPPGIELAERDIQVALDRRRPGRSEASSSRQEADVVEIQTPGKAITMPSKKSSVRGMAILRTFISMASGITGEVDAPRAGRRRPASPPGPLPGKSLPILE